MTKEKLEKLRKLLISNEKPILVENLPTYLFENSVILNNDCYVSQLKGHYENDKYSPPKWYDILIEKSKESHPMLIINGINNISEKEQLKFLEILKYKKVDSFELPKNISIIVTVYDLDKKKVAEEIKGLVACV